MDEEWLPVDTRVCVVGTYDASNEALTPRRSRLGPNLIVYRGSAQQVCERVGKDVGVFAKVTAVLLGSAALWFGFALAPVAWSASIPLVGGLISEELVDSASIGIAGDLFTPSVYDHFVDDGHVVFPQGDVVLGN